MRRIAFLMTLIGVATSYAEEAVTATTPTYQFGNAMFLNTSLRMASFGPMRSEAVDCSTPDYACLRADYLALAVPSHCARGSAETPRYSVGDNQFRRLGRVRYAKSLVTLVYVDTKPGFAFGYTPTGIRFVMISPYGAEQPMAALSKASADDLQRAFMDAKPHLMPAAPGQNMFACDH